MRRITGSLVVAFAAALLLPSVAWAATATGPTPMQRSIALTDPSVVFIDTAVQIGVRLTYQDSGAISGLGSLSQTYNIDWATGSGFVVNPGGTIVTASHVVEPPAQEMQNYAANNLILGGLGYRYGDPYGQYTIPGHPAYTQLLQQCYQGVDCTFQITPQVTVISAVEIAGTQTPKGMPARVLTSTGFQATDVAVLQVAGSDMPTAALATTAGNLQSGDQIVAIGFPGTSRDALQTGVTEPTKIFGQVSNVVAQGSSNLVEIDAAVQPGMSGGPVIDSAGQVIGLTSFTLTQSNGQSGQIFLRTVDDIRTALRAAGVTVSRGLVDTTFAKAMSYFWGRHYTASVPLFQKVLALYPGHPLATEYLAQAQAKAGGPQDLPLKAPSKGLPLVAIIGAAVAVLLVIGLVLVFARRGRGRVTAQLPQAAPAGPIAQQPPEVPAPAPEVSAGAVMATPAGPMPNGTGTAEPAGVTRFEPVSAPVVTAVQDRPAGQDPPVDAPQFCAHCGSHLAADARFCPSCGQARG